MHSLKEILSFQPDGRTLAASGWVRTKRDGKNVCFIALNDGSCMSNLQVVVDKENGSVPAETLARCGTGAALTVTGKLLPSEGGGQEAELRADSVTVLGDTSEAYPLQKKHHSVEFLREIAHLRARTNTFAAVARIRSAMSYAIHTFFQQNGFFYVHTPIITANDCEGAGQMFQVTTLDLDAVAKKALPEGIDYSQDFFGKKANLTVSGQLSAETYACALSRVYTFGPTFRAENSNTTRHLAEFWMIEPEIAFCDLEGNMEIAEAFIKFILKYVLENCREDMEFFDTRIQKGVIETIRQVIEKPFVRITYTEAVGELEKAAASFEFKPVWGCDLQTEHEKYLTEKVFNGPVIVTDYPKEIKAFYMKQNDDGKTVRAMDILVPRLGEIIGGSERESDFGKLTARMKELGLNEKDYDWYLDLRRFGTVAHSGFGLGFERLILYVTGMANIRDVIPYPRTVKNAEF